MLLTFLACYGIMGTIVVLFSCMGSDKGMLKDFFSEFPLTVVCIVLWPAMFSYRDDAQRWLIPSVLHDMNEQKEKRNQRQLEEQKNQELLMEKDYLECLNLIEYDKYGRYGENTYKEVR